MNLLTQPNVEKGWQMHYVALPPCCPVSGNPQPGSYLLLTYMPQGVALEVYSLRAYIHSYIGGRPPIRDMEGMIHAIADDCAATISTPVVVGAFILLQRGDMMTVVYRAK